MAGAPTTPEQSREFAIRSATDQKRGLSPEQQSYIDELRKKAEADPRSAAERMKQGRERQPKGIPQPEVDLVIKNNTKETGTTINGVNIEQRSKVINKYIETGVIDPADEPAILAEIRSHLKRDQDIDAMLSGVIPAAQDRFLNEMIAPLLKDPRGREIVSQLFAETMDKSKILSRQRFQEAKKAADTAADEADKTSIELDQVRIDIPIKEARLAEFADGAGGTPKGSAFIELEKARKALPASKGKLASNQREQQRIRDYLTALDNTRAAILSGRATGDITAIESVITAQETRLNTLATNEITLQATVDRPQQLEEEWDLLKQEVPRLKTQEKELDKKWQSLKQEFQDKDDELTIAEGSQKNSEEAFKREATEVFSTAVRRLLEDKVAVHESKQEEYIEELKKIAATRAEKDLLDAYMNRWASGKIKGRGPLGMQGIFGTTEVTILNRANTQEDFNKLFAIDPVTGARNLNPDGIKDLVTNMLKNPPKTPPYTDPEINQILESDNFKENIMPQVLEGLVAREMQVNPKGLTPREAELIINAPWGDKVIDNALKKNPEAQARIEALRAQGAITGNTAEWLKKHSGKNALLLLLSIIGATAAAALAAPVILGGAVVTGGIGVSSVATRRMFNQ